VGLAPLNAPVATENVIRHELTCDFPNHGIVPTAWIASAIPEPLSLPKIYLTNWDRLLLVWLYRLYPSIIDAVAIIAPDTLIRRHRSGFQAYWRWKSRSRGGRPKIPKEICKLIGEMSRANRLWGAPRIHGELLKLCPYRKLDSSVAAAPYSATSMPQGWNTSS